MTNWAFLNKQEITNQTTEEEKKKEKHKILIVEDNDSLRNMLIGIFETFYTVRWRYASGF